MRQSVEQAERRQGLNLEGLIREHSLVLGFGVDSASPSIAELAGLLGCHAVWADLEHGNINPREAEEFCRGAKAGGALPILRVASASRADILHALEAGAEVVVVPMVSDVATARQIVEHGKYRPLGSRGLAASTRGLFYGTTPTVEAMRQANQRTALFVQIETVEAVERCREILSVDGIAGGLVGPADLSVDFGRPIAFNDPALQSLFVRAIRDIRQAGKIAATASGHPTLVSLAVENGAQLVVCSNERACIRTQLRQTMDEMRSIAAACAGRNELAKPAADSR